LDDDANLAFVLETLPFTAHKRIDVIGGRVAPGANSYI